MSSDGRGRHIKPGSRTRSVTLGRAKAEVDLVERWATMTADQRMNYWPTLTQGEEDALGTTFGIREGRGE